MPVCCLGSTPLLLDASIKTSACNECEHHPCAQVQPTLDHVTGCTRRPWEVAAGSLPEGCGGRRAARGCRGRCGGKQTHGGGSCGAAHRRARC